MIFSKITIYVLTYFSFCFNLILCQSNLNHDFHNQVEPEKDKYSQIMFTNYNNIYRVSDTTNTEADTVDDNTYLIIGGAVRINYFWQDYNEQRKDRNGDFGFELFRIDVNGKYDQLFLSIQYRWYAYFEAVHHAYFGYKFSPDVEFQIGIHRVPFGILPYGSHSFWFDAIYYLGFEDDYDTGFKLIYKPGEWDFQAAFYKNTEYIDASRTERYSFDLVTAEEQTNEEINQFNFRIARIINPVPDLKIDVGGSMEYGQIYNQTTRNKGSRFAYALHSDLYYRSWNFQFQWTHYEFVPKNPEGVDPRTVQLAAFQFPFLIAAKGDVITLNFAKDFELGWLLLDKVKCYIDFSKVIPNKIYGDNSTQIVVGSTLIKKGLYTYVDFIFGQNMWFAGGPGVGLESPDSNKWYSRLNINFGFYF
jgi:hypothetical protein